MKVTEKERLDIFSLELSYIKNSFLQEFTKEFLSTKVPDYFFSVPASSSGKYHPSYALGYGGLVRHTKAAVGIFHELCNADIPQFWYTKTDDCPMFTPEDVQSIVYSALILHDSFKQGNDDEDQSKDQHTVHEHPLIASTNINNFLHEKAKDGIGLYEMALVTKVADAISSHMGKWIASKYSFTLLPSPFAGDAINMLVHECDYLASRKVLEYNFSANEGKSEV